MAGTSLVFLEDVEPLLDKLDQAVGAVLANVAQFREPAVAESTIQNLAGAIHELRQEIGVPSNDTPMEPAPADERLEKIDAVLTDINEEFGCSLHIYTMACPLQLEGDIDGLAVYFRARGQWWSIEIGPEYEDGGPVEGGEFVASWLTGEQLKPILTETLTKYREQSKGDPT